MNEDSQTDSFKFKGARTASSIVGYSCRRPRHRTLTSYQFFRMWPCVSLLKAAVAFALLLPFWDRSCTRDPHSESVPGCTIWV